MIAPRDLVSFRWARHRWLVSSDAGEKSYPTREDARCEAAAIERHPAMRDRRAHGPYRMGGATGRAQVLDLGEPREYRSRDGKPPYDVWAALVRDGLAEWEEDLQP